MREWFYEAGIGEARAALVEDGRIVKARIEPDTPAPRVGAVVAARLVEMLPGRTGRVTFAGGAFAGGEAVLGMLPPGITQGAALTVEIVREAPFERGRVKLARAMPSDAAPAPAPDLLARIAASGVAVRVCHPHEPDRLEAAGWSEVLEEARTGDIVFHGQTGGALRMTPTPAMTLFDVDGHPPLEPLGVAAARAVAAAIVRHDITGSIGIDFPTLPGKAARAAIDAAIDAVLPQPFERTAMNGFGFVQIVRRRSRRSLPELLAAGPVAAEARALLRMLERTPPPLPRVQHVSARVLAAVLANPHWIEALARRTGTAPQFEVA